MNYSDFYNHSSFMKSVREGEKIMARDFAESAKRKKETTDIKVGDIVVSTGKRCTRIEGVKGKVFEIYQEGFHKEFVQIGVDWDYLSRKKIHCRTFEKNGAVRKI